MMTGKLFLPAAITDEDGGWIEINATHQKIAIGHIEKGQEVMIVIGENLLEDKINAYWN